MSMLHTTEKKFFRNLCSLMREGWQQFETARTEAIRQFATSNITGASVPLTPIEI
jgi:hypothetical protein